MKRIKEACSIRNRRETFGFEAFPLVFWVVETVKEEIDRHWVERK